MGFASGLMFLLLGSVDIWLAESGINKAVIGLFACSYLPYTLKFLISPFLEKFHPVKKFTHKKSWIVIGCIIVSIGLISLALSEPKSNLLQILISLFIIAFGCSVQNIAAYSFQVDRVKEEELTSTAVYFVLGFRFGMLTSSYSVLVIAHNFSWRISFCLLAIIYLLANVVFFFREEPLVLPEKNRKIIKLKKIISGRLFIKKILQEYLFIPVKIFTKEKNWVLVLLVIFSVKTGDILCHKMSSIMYLSIGFSKLELANIVKLFGMIAVILGGMTVNLLNKKKFIKNLLVVLFLHTLTNLCYIAVYYAGHSVKVLSATIFMENFTGGMLMSMFLSFLYFYSNKSLYPAVMYTFFFAVYSCNTIFSGMLSGFLAEKLGWTMFFIAAFFISLLVCFLVFLLYKKSKGYLFRE